MNAEVVKPTDHYIRISLMVLQAHQFDSEKKFLFSFR